MKTGRLDISKTSSNHEDDYVSVVLVDEVTGKRVVQIKVSLLEWAQACFSLGARPVEYRTWPEQPK